MSSAPIPSELSSTPERIAELRNASLEWPSLNLSDGQRRDLDLLASGAFFPLRSFSGHAERACVLARGSLLDGTAWPVPVVLEVPAALAGVGTSLALRDPEGVMLSVLHIEEEVGKGPVSAVSGRLEVIEREPYWCWPGLARSPGEWRSRAAQAGIGTTAALVSAEPLVLGDLEAAQREAEALGARLLVLALLGAPAPGDQSWRARVRSDLAALVALGEGVASLVAVARPSCLDYPQSSGIWRDVASVLASNYGASHLIGAGKTMAGQGEERTGFSAGESGASTPLAREPTTQQAGRAWAGRGGGFTVFFTGLSGAGKSTLANALAARLGDSGRVVSLLDGDLVRRHLSSELGFSKQHRDLNVRRIGWVAAEVTKHGGVAICAPIAPYDSVREEVRAMVEEVGGFLLVYLSTPLEVCEARDRKGLYAKARAGVVKEFTGVSDPYEVPRAPELCIDTSAVGPEDALGAIVSLLRRRGYLAEE